MKEKKKKKRTLTVCPQDCYKATVIGWCGQEVDTEANRILESPGN